MKRLVAVLAMVTTNAMAIDFDSEWSKFDADFHRLRGTKVAMAKTMPVEPDSSILPSLNTKENVLEQVDPKSPDRLGYKLEDPKMRDKVVSLYKKPDTVVYSLTLE
jgi:hypothetical protein